LAVIQIEHGLAKTKGSREIGADPLLADDVLKLVKTLDCSPRGDRENVDMLIRDPRDLRRLLGKRLYASGEGRPLRLRRKVPFRHKDERLWVRATATTVEVLLRGKRVAAHPRRGEGRYSTVTEHMPSSHRAQRRTWRARAGALLSSRSQVENAPAVARAIRAWQANNTSRLEARRSCARR
jgi:hypothetical protein